MRSVVEKAKYGTTGEIDGIEFVRAPIMDEAMDLMGIAQRYVSPLISRLAPSPQLHPRARRLMSFADDEADVSRPLSPVLSRVRVG